MRGAGLKESHSSVIGALEAGPFAVTVAQTTCFDPLSGWFPPFFPHTKIHVIESSLRSLIAPKRISSSMVPFIVLVLGFRAIESSKRAVLQVQGKVMTLPRRIF